MQFPFVCIETIIDVFVIIILMLGYTIQCYFTVKRKIFKFVIVIEELLGKRETVITVFRLVAIHKKKIPRYINKHITH